MMQKRKRRDERQPKCHVVVCRNSCSYKEKPFRVEVLDMDNEKDSVFLLKEMKKGEWHACIVMYLNGKCEMKGKAIGKNAFSFMRNHVPRIMEDCPLRMEHLISVWSNEKSN